MTVEVLKDYPAGIVEARWSVHMKHTFLGR
jgi:hypothetical protein